MKSLGLTPNPRGQNTGEEALLLRCLLLGFPRTSRQQRRFLADEQWLVEDRALVVLLFHPGGDFGPHFGQPLGVLWIAGQIVLFVGVGGEIGL